MSAPLPFVLVVTDGSGMRAFHRAVLPENHRAAVDVIVRHALARIAAMAQIPSPAAAAQVSTATMTQHEISRASGYTGEVCRACGSFATKRTGTCVTCEACGSNEGCG